MASKQKGKNKKGKMQSAVTVVVVLLFLAGIVALALLFPYMSRNSPQSITVKVPLIVTKMTSATDGSEYTVQTQFSVRMDKADRKDVSEAMLHEALTEIMAEMDVDAIIAYNGIDYVNLRATEELNAYLAEYIETKVFVTGLFVGDQLSLSDGPTQQEEVMKGLFKKIE